MNDRLCSPRVDCGERPTAVVRKKWTMRLGARSTAILVVVCAAFSLGGVERAVAQVCGNDIAEPPEECDGIDNGVCLSSCTAGCLCPEEPNSCTFGGVGANASRNPAGTVYPGETVCYAFRYDNGIGGINCDVVNLDADFWLPNSSPYFPLGTGIHVLVDVSIPSGDTLLCPSDPRCNPALTAGDYCYLVSLADDVASFGGCPPTLGSPPGPGVTGKVVAYTEGLGDALTELGDIVAPCTTANNIVARCGDGIANTGICLNSNPRVICNGGCPAGTTCIGRESCDLTAQRNGIVCIADFEGDADLCRAPGSANECTCCGDSLIQTGET